MSLSAGAENTISLSFLTSIIVLQTVFITLKTTHQVSWDWLTVFLPVWGPIAFVLAAVMGVFGVWVIISGVQDIYRKLS